jgi:HEAT repeats
MATDELQRLYDRARSANPNFDERQELVAALLAREDREAIEYHYGLIRDRSDRRLYLDVRTSFKKRGKAAEAFSLEAYPREPSTSMRADILLLLGGLRSSGVRRLALDALSAEDEELRHKAVIVLGWVGTVKDMKTVLRDRLLHDPSPLVRGDTASAYRQIWYRMPRVKETAERDFAEALAAEDDEYAVSILVISLQTIARRRFGLKETDGDIEIVGDVEEAKARAQRYLSSRLEGMST